MTALLFCLLQVPSRGGVFVSDLTKSKEWQGVVIEQGSDTISFIKTTQQDGVPHSSPYKPKLAEVTQGGVRFQFQAELWQQEKIDRQLKLYQEIVDFEQGGRISTDLSQLEASAWSAVNPGPYRIKARSLKLVRSLTFTRGGLSITAPLSLAQRPQPDTSRWFQAPPLTVPYVGGEHPASAWVQFPTQYTFVTYGKINAQGLAYWARAEAIKLLDDHLNEFKKSRATVLGGLAARVDGLDGIVGEGLPFTRLAAAWQRAVRASLQASGTRTLAGVSLEAWLADSTISDAELRLFLEESSDTGAVVDVEIP